MVNFLRAATAAVRGQLPAVQQTANVLQLDVAAVQKWLTELKSNDRAYKSISLPKGLCDKGRQRAYDVSRCQNRTLYAQTRTNAKKRWHRNFFSRELLQE